MYCTVASNHREICESTEALAKPNSVQGNRTINAYNSPTSIRNISSLYHPVIPRKLTTFKGICAVSDRHRFLSRYFHLEVSSSRNG